MLNHYFKQLNADLKKKGTLIPQLIVDDAALNQNISLARQKLVQAKHLKPRLVVKSLGCMNLIKVLSEQIDTQKFMVFHQPHIILILENFSEADILLGKPMPAQETNNFYEQYLGKFDQRIQWLIDTKERVQQYLDIAIKYSICLHLNIEIDVGLHRGGVQSSQQLTAMLELIQLNPQYLKFSGFMGYDAHVTKVPSVIKKPELVFLESQNIYSQYQEIVKNQYPMLWSNELCFNGGGSPTFNFHVSKSVCNDLSFGSMLLKPSDFDTKFLKNFKPALWIAAPVLKILPFTQLPAMSMLDKLPHKSKAVFIYGGYWLADYYYPEKSHTNLLYGRSTNQELVNVPKNCDIQVDDFVFLRPTQSEVIIPQFAELKLYSNNDFESWQTFRD